jgi:uncharacterized protein YjcR
MKRYKITENKTGQKFAVSALNEQEAKERVKRFLKEDGDYDYLISNSISVLANNMSIIQQQLDLISSGEDLGTNIPYLIKQLKYYQKLMNRCTEHMENLINSLINRNSESDQPLIIDGI